MEELFKDSVLRKQADRPSKPSAPQKTHIQRGNLGRHHVFRPLTSDASLLRRELTKAVKERRLHRVNQLWQAMVSKAEASAQNEPALAQPSTEHDSATKSDTNGGVLSLDLCNQFILSYMTLRQPGLALEVWNTMISASLQPDLASWNAMLEGCKVSRNLTSLESVWAKLLTSGDKPDMACWTTRISGLAECGKPDLAIRALNEMGALWLHAARKNGITDYAEAGDIDDAIKPTIETINAAIAGLLRRPKGNESVQRILAWGGTLGIQPDIITFNTLLRSLVRSGPPGSVPALLQQMQASGIQADVATYTTLLDELFKSSSPRSLEAQTAMVNSVFSEMEAAGIEANLWTYGKMIYALLQSNPGDKELVAVRAVLQRMKERGVEPSTYIYTTLISHHFSQSPPDLLSVRHLLERIALSSTIMDHIFWDRVIEGYASVDDTSQALNILGKVDRPGQRVGWPALQMVVHALVRNGEWEAARRVVADTARDRGGPPRREERGVEGQHGFWRCVAEWGLMPEG